MSSHCFKKFIGLTLCLVIFGYNNASSQEKNELSSIEQKLVKDALKSINQKLSDKTGKLERISCCYKVVGSDPLSASIKTFYVDYRKAAEYQNYDFRKAKELASCDPDQIIEIIYKSHEKNQLTIVSKKNKRRSCKYVSIS